MSRLITLILLAMTVSGCPAHKVNTDTCGAGPACELGYVCVTGECRQVCYGASDCPAGRSCVEGTCTGGATTKPAKTVVNVISGAGRLTGGGMTFDVQVGAGSGSGPASGNGGMKLQGGGVAHPGQQP